MEEFDKSSIKSLKKVLLCSTESAEIILETISEFTPVGFPIAAKKNKEAS